MSFIIDDPEIERQLNDILLQVKHRKNGETAQILKKHGLQYKMTWGVSVPELKEIAKDYKKNHLLAFKLWNKQWRESKILATLLDEPKKVTEEQMDFWTKNFDNIEIAEQAVVNLWVHTPFSFVKALEWCRGKKHIVKFTGLHLMGRLAFVDKKALDEMFEPFFEVIVPLVKDEKLETIFFRSVVLVGSRSKQLNTLTKKFSERLIEHEMENVQEAGNLIYEELNSSYIQKKII